MWWSTLLLCRGNGGFEARSDVAAAADTARAGARRQTAQTVSRLTGGWILPSPLGVSEGNKWFYSCDTCKNTSQRKWDSRARSFCWWIYSERDRDLRFTPGFDLKFTREQILAFPELLQIYIYKYSWRSKKSKLYCFSSDNGKFFNHSNDPNVLSEYRNNEEEAVTVAIRDIQAGEEILDNYNSFEDEKSAGDVLDEIAEKYHLKDELDPRFHSHDQ